MTLFSKNNSIVLPNAELNYYPDFYSKEEADNLFNYFNNSVNWQTYKIKIFGKTYDQPRLTAFYNNSNSEYSYSNLKLRSNRFNAQLLKIKEEIFNKTSIEFNSALLNYYRNGIDSNGWHADNEKELGINPIIASISLGEQRIFKIKHNTIKTQKYDIELAHGSLLLMKGEMQHFWKHQIPKSKKVGGGRINLTFRQL